MFVELSTGITLSPGTFTAVIAPGRSVIAALEGNRDLRRFFSLFVCSPASHLLPEICRTVPHFELCVSTSAAEIMARVQNARCSILIVEHDPALFDGAEQVSAQLSAVLRDLGRGMLVMLYAHMKDPSFIALARNAHRFIEFIPPDEHPVRPAPYPFRTHCGGIPFPRTQKTLPEVS